MKKQRKTLLLVFILAMLAPLTAAAQGSCPCLAPNVGGTAALMPTSCGGGYDGFLNITNGLPPVSTIDMIAELTNFTNTTEVAGGSLGGNVQTFDATMLLQVSGTGALNGFQRSLSVNVSGVAHSAPRIPGQPLQSFPHELVSLQGQLFGDPDFCTLRIQAGSDLGLPPSPGQTSLVRQGPVGSPFSVDSFFDVTYEVTFQGCPGSLLEGMQGTTQDTHRFLLCETPVPNEPISWGAVKSLY